MPDHLRPNANASSSSLTPLDAEEHARLRTLNRTPKPYHHLSPELPYASDRFTVRDSKPTESFPKYDEDDQHHTPPYLKDSSPASESGTEADDEHFLKGLPAPKVKLHKGLRGQEESISRATTPLPSPRPYDKDGSDYLKKPHPPRQAAERKRPLEILRRNKNLVQRATEAAIVTSLGLMVRANDQVKPLMDDWGRDYTLLGLAYTLVLSCYPLRVAAWEYRHGTPSKLFPVSIPTDFDPAPILYPPAITVCVSLLVATDNPAVILPNIVLAVCSWPQQVIPRFETNTPYDSVHWALACVPIAWNSLRQASPSELFLSEEDLTLLYPLHQILCVVLHHLTTTSLLTAELQLFSIALINVLVLASSPQIQILKALLWVGGVSVLVLCGSIIKSGIILARVPKWRFRKIASQKQRSVLTELTKVFSWRRIKSEVLGDALDPAAGEGSSSESEVEFAARKRPVRVQTLGLDPRASLDPTSPTSPTSDTPDLQSTGLTRRHTLSYADGPSPTSNNLRTASGRKRRAMSVSVRPFLKLTYTQAVIRKWLYALYVYLVLASVIIAGVRIHIQKVGLHGTEPIGFALAYMLGDWPWFRFQVVKAHLGDWIPLPPRPSESDAESQLGWVQHMRHNDFGEANTRLLLAAYWFTVFVIGLLTVFRLKEIYEVDTRRKVFHFMMVGILLPATFVDPTFAALALALILAIFLMLDLLRASQLPPLSKPIASFLAPYVDGRDFRGPVVISHIFLLIGCAIPLWLALAALPRTGDSYLSGWEVPTREVSMVSGVVCVGLGDAAASLIGRRYGRRKWFWGGGKSLEGSVAFALAVFMGLTAATVWLRLGGWPVAGERPGVFASARNAAACGTMASLTEAVLTGGNDNVIVPVVLWTCVKSLSV